MSRFERTTPPWRSREVGCLTSTVSLRRHRKRPSTHPRCPIGAYRNARLLDALPPILNDTLHQTGTSSYDGHHVRATALVTLVVLSLVARGRASAHATLTTSTPSDQQTGAKPPDRVQLNFTEPVETSLGGIRVFDGNAKRVDTGSPPRAGRNSVAVNLNPGLANGTYTVSWSVLSADGHPIDGGCPRLHWTGGEIIL